jgi:hypothetical protein
MKKKTKSYFDLLGSIVHNTQKKALKELNLNFAISLLAISLTHYSPTHQFVNSSTCQLANS